jgi:hypothetical protein
MTDERTKASPTGSFGRVRRTGHAAWRMAFCARTFLAHSFRARTLVLGFARTRLVGSDPAVAVALGPGSSEGVGGLGPSLVSLASHAAPRSLCTRRPSLCSLASLGDRSDPARRLGPISLVGSDQSSESPPKERAPSKLTPPRVSSRVPTSPLARSEGAGFFHYNWCRGGAPNATSVLAHPS